MKQFVIKLGKAGIRGEDIKHGCMLFSKYAQINDDFAKIIRDNEIEVEATTLFTLQEMSSEKTNYGYFLLNKSDGNYILYDFVLSIIDDRINDIDYVAEYVCLPLINKLIQANPSKDVYLRIFDKYGNEYLNQICAHTTINNVDILTAQNICERNNENAPE